MALMQAIWLSARIIIVLERHLQMLPMNISILTRYIIMLLFIAPFTYLSHNLSSSLPNVGSYW